MCFYYELCLALILLCFAVTASAATIPMDKSFISSLDGTWRFKLEQAKLPAASLVEGQTPHPVEITETFEQFYKTDYKENSNWHDMNVPSNWEMAGYSPATYWNPDTASAEFRRLFTVPASWKGRVVKINFDGVQNGAEIWVNGQPVSVTEPSWGRDNYHESGWTAWQADLTPVVKFGETNLLAIRVTKNTKSSNLDSGDYYFLGGLYRPVTLFSVPATHVSDLTITTHLLPDNKAQVKIVAAVAGSDPSRVSIKLEGHDPITAEVKDGKVELTQIVSKPKLWSAEYPNLYNLDVTLKDAGGKAVESVTRRVGIREVTIKDGIFYVNGKIVKLAGICRHDLSANEGCAVGPDLWHKDLTLMKAANINSIRTSHYPYGTGFYDMCDEMGFYVIDELPYCWCPTDTDELTPAYAQRARETIIRDKNHACVIIWGIGNENKPGRNLQVVADIVKSLDTTRPRLVSEQPADRYGVELDDAHYTPPGNVQKAANDKARRALWPKVYTENPNVWDVRFGADYGCLDIWGEVIKRTWDVIWKSDGIPGTYLWEWQDRAVADKCPTKLYQFDPATGINYVKVKGLVDSHRNVRPDYYQLKMATSPVQVANKIDLKSQPGKAVLDITNHYSFTDLSELKANWRLTKDGKLVKSGTAKLKLAPRSSGRVALALPEGLASKADTLRIDFDHPQGWNVVTYQFALRSKTAKSALDSHLPDGLGFPRLNLVSKVTAHDPATWIRIYRTRYQLANVKTDPVGPAALTETLLANVRSMDADIVCGDASMLPENPTPGDAQKAKVTLPTAGQVVGRVHAEYAAGKFSYKIEWTGEKAEIEELGWVFDMPKAFDHFSWDRKAMWSYYPEKHIGRPTGTALPDTMNVHLTNITRPDAFDFNSTKYNCNWASLTDAKGQGLRLQFAAKERQQVRGGLGLDGGYSLIVNKQCSPPRDISTNCVPDLYLELKPGDVIEGSFKLGSNKTK